MHQYQPSECPMCESYANHQRTADGYLRCATCNTSWGDGPSTTGADWLPQPPPVR